jgi:hypothetical protein
MARLSGALSNDLAAIRQVSGIWINLGSQIYKNAGEYDKLRHPTRK